MYGLYLWYLTFFPERHEADAAKRDPSPADQFKLIPHCTTRLFLLPYAM
jgi:hypothetical protein